MPLLIPKAHRLTTEVKARSPFNNQTPLHEVAYLLLKNVGDQILVVDLLYLQCDLFAIQGSKR